MLRVAVIDDDETEEKIWCILEKKHFPVAISVSFFQDIDAAIQKISTDDYDVVIVDNHIPPHISAQYALDRLKSIKYFGRVIVFSNSDVSDLNNMLGQNNEAEVVSKQDFMAIPQMYNFVENVLIGYETISAQASG